MGGFAYFEDEDYNTSNYTFESFQTDLHFVG